MGNFDSESVNLHDARGDRTDPTNVHPRTTREGAGMLKAVVVDRIRELAEQGVGVKKIARMLRISRNSARRYLAGAAVGFQERPEARRLDDELAARARRLFDDVAEGNAVVIQQELARESIRVELRTLQRAVAELRRERRAEKLATVRFETPPGKQIQIDFGEKVVMIADQPVRVHLMTAVLGHSRRLYCRGFLAERQDDWFEGLDGAFRHFGGLTEEVLCDNASPLVVSHDPGSGKVVFHPGFEIFCRDRGLTPKACRPRRARTKGKIERGVGYVKHNALAGRRFASFAELQGHLARWAIDTADQRIHGTTHEKPAVRFERDEREALRPMSPRPPASRTRRLKRRVSADCFVDVDTIRYSVPYKYVKETVEVAVKDEEVEIWLRGDRIATHRRCLEPRASVRVAAHFEGLYRLDVQASARAAAGSPGAASPVIRPLSVYAEAAEGARP